MGARMFQLFYFSTQNHFRQMKQLFVFWLLSLLTVAAAAQSSNDALRYSQTTAGSTARSAAVGGSFGALGADFSAVNNNPAGLGLYQKSELTLTSAINFTNTESNYIGTTTDDNRSNFNLNNAGLVLAGKDRSDFNLNYALGFNRVANYNQQFMLNAYNNQNSISGYYADIANGIPEEQLIEARPLDAGLAYYTFLINPTEPGGSEYTAVAPNGNVQQTQTTINKGGRDEYLLSLGGNYKDKLYFGATLGLPYTHFTSETDYSESQISDPVNGLVSYKQIDKFKTTGLGVNGKFGLIYRFGDAFRAGLAAHTPTLNTLKDVYSSSFTSSFVSGPDIPFQSSEEFQSEYSVTSPWRFQVSAAGVFKKLGFLSAEYEWVDYSQMEIGFNNDVGSELLVNEDIRTRFQAASNLRVGAEGAIKNFRIRGGYSFYGSPYKTADSPTQALSVGLGVREDKLFADVAFVRQLNETTYTPYTDAPTATLNSSRNSLLVSLGFRF